MKRNIPTRIVETGRLMRGSSGQGVGWLRDLADRARNLHAKLVGIQERLTTPLRDGVPDCIDGELTFKADESRTISITNYPDDPDTVPPAAFIGTLLVNPIILAGQTYQIPIQFTPPGVLEANHLVVGIEAGFTMFANQNRPGITPLNDYRQVRADESGQGFGFTNPNLGVGGGVIQYTYQQQVLGNFSEVIPYLPFLWNIVDRKSGREYGSSWIPSGLLLNTRGNAAPMLHVDSDLFEFDAPWLFERDAEVSFLFRPLMDLYQVAAADATLPYGSNDLTGGRRFEQATVKVEFHGIRYFTSQDVLKDGAYVHDHKG